MKNYLIFIFILILIGCEPKEENIRPAEDRINEAKTDLIAKLTEPANGWVLNYQPIPGAGIYYILLDFKEDGTVAVQSDVLGDDGIDFYFDTLSYRIDNRLTLELIFETYGVFHYLFEQRASTFEAEFEFRYVEESGNNLVFISKTDVSTDQTVITLEPAASDAEDLFSREAYANWNSFEKNSPQFLGASPAQHIVLSNQNVSIFWNIDFLERNMHITAAGVGSTIDEVSATNKFTEIDHTTGYQISDGKLQLLSPFSFTLDGSNYTISEIELANYTLSGPPACVSDVENTPVYTGTISGTGPCTINKTLYDYEGSFFEIHMENPYSVNVLFVVDSDGYSLSQSGSINEYFPNATGFAFNYGYMPGVDDPQEPSYAVGLYVEDENGDIQTYLREFEMTTTVGNRVQVNLLDNYYFSDTPSPSAQQNLELITDEIFAEGTVYASGVEAEDLTVFRLYNPCNGYEVYLVQ